MTTNIAAAPLTEHNQAPDGHLAALSAALVAAESADRPDPGAIAAQAWDLLGELTEVTSRLLDSDRPLGELTAAAQAAVAGARDGHPDPVTAVREVLRARGQLPPRHLSPLAVLGWAGAPPARHRRHLTWLSRHTRPLHAQPARAANGAR